MSFYRNEHLLVTCFEVFVVLFMFNYLISEAIICAHHKVRSTLSYNNLKDTLVASRKWYFRDKKEIVKRNSFDFIENSSDDENNLKLDSFE